MMLLDWPEKMAANSPQTKAPLNKRDRYFCSVAASHVRINQRQGCSANDATTEQTGLIAPFGRMQKQSHAFASTVCCSKLQPRLGIFVWV